MSRVSQWIIGYEPFKIRLPDLKCRTLSVVTSVLLGATGLLLTFFLGDPRWFARFGSLIVLVAVSYAYFGRLTSSHILDWAETSKNTVIDALELQADLDKRGSDSSTPVENRLRSPLGSHDREVIETATGLQGEDVGGSAKGSYDVLLKLTENAMLRDHLAEFLNRRIGTLEIAIGAVGTIIWGFGDLLVPVR